MRALLVPSRGALAGLFLFGSFGLLAPVGCGLVEDTIVAPGDGDAGSQGIGAVGNHDAGASTGTTTQRDAADASVVMTTLGSHFGCTHDTDCVRDGENGKCVALVPGGFRVCEFPPPPPLPCRDAGSGGFFPDECCGTTMSTCLTGVCTRSTWCGGAFINPHNVCASDECGANADCGVRGVCLPTGVGNTHQRTCLRANECVADGECTARPGGACVLIGSAAPGTSCTAFSCDGPEALVATRMQCSYPGECRDDGDCAGHCEPVPLPDGAAGDGSRLRCAAGRRSVCPPPP